MCYLLNHVNPKYMFLVNLSCRGIGNCKWKPQIVSGIPKLLADSANCKRNPHKIAESTYICGIRLHLRNPEQLPKFARCRAATKSMYRQNLRYRYLYVTRNPLKFFKWNPLTFCYMFKDLSLESRSIQTQNCALIQYTVWPRNVEFVFLNKKEMSLTQVLYSKKTFKYQNQINSRHNFEMKFFFL